MVEIITITTTTITVDSWLNHNQWLQTYQPDNRVRKRRVTLRSLLTAMGRVVVEDSSNNYKDNRDNTTKNKQNIISSINNHNNNNKNNKNIL